MKKINLKKDLENIIDRREIAYARIVIYGQELFNKDLFTTQVLLTDTEKEIILKPNHIEEDVSQFYKTLEETEYYPELNPIALGNIIFTDGSWISYDREEEYWDFYRCPSFEEL